MRQDKESPATPLPPEPLVRALPAEAPEALLSLQGGHPGMGGQAWVWSPEFKPCPSAIGPRQLVSPLGLSFAILK